MPLPTGRTARWVVRILVSVAVVVYILVDVDTGDLLRDVTHVRLPLIGLAFLVYLGGQALSAYKWSLLGRSVGFHLPYATYARFYFIGMFFNLFGPSTIGGDLARALYLGGGRRPVLAGNSVLFDRVSGLAVLTALGAWAFLAFPQYELPWPLVGVMVAGGMAIVFGWWLCPRLVGFLPETNRIRRQVEDDLEPFWRDRRLLVRVSLVSLAFHLTQISVQYVLARAAHAEVPFSYCLIFHPVVSVMTALPVSVAGLGVREGGYLYFLTRPGIDVEDSAAVTMGLCWFLVTALAGLVGGILLARAGELPRLRADSVRSAA